MLRSYNNEKQSGWSVGGYTGPGAEILIKASWHLKSSVIRQSIWVKRAPFWLSDFRPTLERGTPQANKAAGKSDTSAEEVLQNMPWWQQLGGTIGFHWWSCVYITHAICMRHLFWPGLHILYRTLSSGPWLGWNCKTYLTRSHCPAGKEGWELKQWNSLRLRVRITIS